MSDILNLLNNQLDYIDKRLKKNLEKGLIDYNYSVIEKEAKFLDTTSLLNHLSTNTFNNDYILKSICNNCNLIFEKLIATNNYKFAEFSDDWERKIIEISKGGIYEYTFSDHLYLNSQNFNLSQINEKVFTIFDIITTIFSDINIYLTPKYKFYIYQTLNIFELRHTDYIYTQNDFKKFKKKLEIYLAHYHYIFKKIEDKQKFKSYTINHLTQLKDTQNNEKFIKRLSEAIENITKDFFPQINAISETSESPSLIINNDSKKQDIIEIKKELHTHIFKDNAFEVWESMFNEFNIDKKSRTNVKFMFEEMKKDGLIHKTVNQKMFLDWLSGPPYEITVEKTSNHNRTTTRLNAYSRAKQLYKN